MCTTCGCSDTGKLSAVEEVKTTSNQLRGTIAAELRDAGAVFSEPAGHILKSTASTSRTTVSVVQSERGLAAQPISYRMTGCPNGCARPYLGDVGMVGTTLGKYDIFLGGDFEGTRLNELYMHNVPLEDIPDVLAGPLAEYARSRREGEGFGDWCHRHDVKLLAERFSLQEASA